MCKLLVQIISRFDFFKKYIFIVLFYVGEAVFINNFLLNRRIATVQLKNINFDEQHDSILVLSRADVNLLP